MEYTTDSSAYIRQKAVGFMVNSQIGLRARLSIKDLQNDFVNAFDDKMIWIPPQESLHITLLDWLAPLADYDSQDKDVLYKELSDSYDDALLYAIHDIGRIELTFERAIVSPSAVALVADERATEKINSIRQRFLDRVELLPETKRPPAIVHSTIARFTGQLALRQIEEFFDTRKICIDDTLETFRLVRETELPMLSYEIMKTYDL